MAFVLLPTYVRFLSSQLTFLSIGFLPIIFSVAARKISTSVFH